MKGDPGPALPGLPPSPQGLALVGQVDMRQMGQASSARARVEDEVRGHCLRRKSAAQAKRTWEGGPRWEGISCPQASVLASLSASFPLLLPPAPTSCNSQTTLYSGNYTSFLCHQRIQLKSLVPVVKIATSYTAGLPGFKSHLCFCSHFAFFN